jgi:hypothetical protein
MVAAGPVGVVAPEETLWLLPREEGPACRLPPWW